MSICLFSFTVLMGGGKSALVAAYPFSPRGRCNCIFSKSSERYCSTYIGIRIKKDAKDIFMSEQINVAINAKKGDSSL